MLKKILNLGLVAILSLSMLVGCENTKGNDAENAKIFLLESNEIQEVFPDFDSYECSLDIYTDKDTVVIDLIMDSYILEVSSESGLKELSNDLALGVSEMKQELKDLGNDASIKMVVKDAEGNEYVSIKDGVVE